MPKNLNINDHNQPFSPNLVKAIEIIVHVNGCDFINTRNTHYLKQHAQSAKIVNHDAEIHLKDDIHACAAFNIHKDSERVEQAVLITLTYKTYNRAIISLPKAASAIPIPDHLATHKLFGKSGGWEKMSLTMKEIIDWAYDEKTLYRI